MTVYQSRDYKKSITTLKISIITISLILMFYFLTLFIPGWLRLGPPGTYMLKRNYFRIKANFGDRESMYKVAELYDEIKMSYKNSEIAHEWYEKAASNGHPIAISRLSWDKKWMNKGVELKIEHCLNEMSRSYRYGLNGFEINYDKSNYLSQESNRIYTLRRKLPFNRDISNSYNGLEVEHQFNDYKKKLEMEFLAGNYKLGLKLFEVFNDLDMPYAISMLQKGAENDSKCAHFLANAYQRGEFGLKEDKQAFYRWFLHARHLESKQGRLK